MPLAREKVPVVLEPTLELLPLPALREMVAKEGERGFQFRPPKEPGEIMPALVAIRSVYATAELIGELAERKWVARVKLYLEARLLPVGGERAFSDNEAHNVPNIEFAHGSIIVVCSALEQRHVAQLPVLGLHNEPRGTSRKLRRARQPGGLFSVHSRTPERS
jgi:hypothetical protein